ncbi:uncharacterized protein AB675_1578 [Cyphellophora attinorum]|uniref:Transcription factor domain-containing protein n=1 Tax=Cyphellophora attinorum TaxID=1664694 RepID=A0A0N1H6Y7_9EURO|nr:uncharacterized protein AB675_1578 [Phialophora attinorum]KPI37262.1 hypothetical protein AB675_1578 [Phialophora attinorum]
MGTPLLFVNKDTTNFYSNTRQDAARVASHVVTKYRPWKKQKAGLDLSTSTRAILSSNKRRKVDEHTQELYVPSPQNEAPQLGQYDSAADTPSTGLSSIFSPEESPLPPPSSSSSSTSIVAASTTVIADDLQDYYDNLESELNVLSTSKEDAIEAVTTWRLLGNPSPLLGYCSLDPFSTYGTEMDSEMRYNVHFYFQVIRPFATHLIDGWWWCDSAPQIQCSRALSYAVAAYASLFVSGCVGGGPGVVLPPPTEPGQRARWRNPPWLRLQTICVSELNSQLQSSDDVDDSSFAAMLFLFRISVLLADGDTARIHARGLRKLGSYLSTMNLNLNAELAVAKVNIISAFLHHRSTVVVRHRPDHTKRQLSHVVDLDQNNWTLSKPWHSMRGALAARVLAWRDEEPAASLQDRTEAEVVRMDPDFRSLAIGDQLELQLCYQIGLFLVHILHCVSFNTAAPRIRSNALLLKVKISNMDLSTLVKICPRLIFNLLLQGAIATHSYIERLWFVGSLSHHFPRVQWMDEVKSQIAYFVDPMTLVNELVEEVWVEVQRLRGRDDTMARAVLLWREDTSWTKGEKGTFRGTAPDVHARVRRIVESVDGTGIDVKAEFE